MTIKENTGNLIKIGIVIRAVKNMSEVNQRIKQIFNVGGL